MRSRRRAFLAVRRLLLPVTIPLLTGCALRVSDSRGRAHTIGLIWATSSPSASADAQTGLVLGPSVEPDAAVIRWRTLGVSSHWTPATRGLVLGYDELFVIRPALDDGLTTTDFDSSDPFSASLRFTPAPPADASPSR